MLNYSSSSIIIALLLFYSLSACKKGENKKEEKTYTPVPFLTARTWIADTITINLPMTYSQLNNADQQSYRGAIGWFRLAKLTLNDDGTVTCGGDYDVGYKNWRLVNNNLDIEMTSRDGSIHVLRNWVADNSHFSYTVQFNYDFDCTHVYK
jgi:hypothetical protein